MCITGGDISYQQGIVSTFFSGAGRQPISASPVLFLANADTDFSRFRRTGGQP